MKKLENASSNLKEILCAIVDGKDVQFCMYDNWRPLEVFDFIFSEDGLKSRWRIKPDAFEDFYMDCKFNNKIANKNTNELMRMAWNAAMDTLSRSLEALKLEQQIKGINYVINNAQQGDDTGIHYFTVQSALAICEEMKEQAKQLKEQGDD